MAGVRVDPRQNGSYIYIVQGIPSYEIRELRRFPLHGSTYELREAKLRPLPHGRWIEQRARWGDAMTEAYEAALASAALAPPPPPDADRRERMRPRSSEPEPRHVHASAQAFRAAPRTTPSAAEVAADFNTAVCAAVNRRLIAQRAAALSQGAEWPPPQPPPPPPRPPPPPPPQRSPVCMHPLAAWPAFDAAAPARPLFNCQACGGAVQPGEESRWGRLHRTCV